MKKGEILAEKVTEWLSEFVLEVEPELRENVEYLSLRLSQSRVTFDVNPGFDYSAVWRLLGECLMAPLMSYAQMIDEPSLRASFLAEIERFALDGDGVSIDEFERFSENLDVASSYLNSYGFTRSDKLAENGLILLSRIVASFYEEAVLHSKKVCLFCFRKIDVGVACALHLAKDDVPLRYQGQKVHLFLEKNAPNLLERYRIQRALMGDNAVPEGGGDDEEVMRLCHSIGNEKWQDISVNVSKYVEREFPYVYKLVGEGPFSATNFLECKRLLYSREFLNNELDRSESPYWFFRTLGLANLWIAAETEMERPKNERARRNQNIKRMYEDGVSLREIASEVKTSVSTVHKVVKAIKEESAGL